MTRPIRHVSVAIISVNVTDAVIAHPGALELGGCK